MAQGGGGGGGGKTLVAGPIKKRTFLRLPLPGGEARCGGSRAARAPEPGSGPAERTRV